MPYKTEEYSINELEKIIAEEGKKTNPFIEWGNVRLGYVVVFCREIPSNPNALRISIAANEKMLKKERKERAEIVFMINGMSGLVKSLAISGKHAKAPSRDRLLAHTSK